MTSSRAAATIPAQLADRLDMLLCPACGAVFEIDHTGTALRCAGCSRTFSVERGVAQLFWPTDFSSKVDVTEAVKAFYEETPFPNYDDLDSPERLRAKAEEGLFARLLNDQIPHGAKVIECGCGTGQLSNFLGLTWGRTVFGTDLCMNSLRLGHGFKDQHDITGVSFVQMNLFRPAFRPGSFDVVISNGVLHHTSDPYGGFQSILRLLKRGGFIIIGLYNTYGRLTTDLRRLVFRLSGDRFKSLDPRLRTSELNDARRRAWFMDQYKHPHESKHTFGEVLRWFDESGVEFINSIPKATATDRFSPTERLFEPQPQGTAFDRFIVQAGMLMGGGREGGFFIMVGRRKPERDEK